MSLSCRSCQAPIAFIEMESGRRMPVDPELVKTYVVPPALGDKPRVLVTERGKVIRGTEVSLTHAGAEAAEGYVPHWSTCPSAGSHRARPGN